MDKLANKLLSTLEQAISSDIKEAKSLEIALSGGLDSIVLLHLLFTLKKKYHWVLTAVHVHHGLQAVADEWVVFCQGICHQYGIPLRTEYVHIEPDSPLGVEGSAREARYNIFRQSTADIVVLAHHANDQTETFLLSLLRGGGLRGMCAMPMIRPLTSTIKLWRPLLNIPRQILEEYAQQHNLSHIDDPSNSDTRYLRNWLRHDILPCIRERIPHCDAHIQHNINHFQHCLSLIDDAVALANSQVIIEGKWHCEYWVRLPENLRLELLYHFVQAHGLGTPRHQSIMDFAIHLYRQPHQTHTWHLPNGTAYAHHGYLYAWGGQQAVYRKCVTTQDGWQNSDIKWYHAPQGLPENLSNWHIRCIQITDSLYTNIGEKSAVKLLKDKYIPSFIRPYWPVITDDYDRCIAVVGIRVDSRYTLSQGILPHIDDLVEYL